jgi:hypothetical protein
MQVHIELSVDDFDFLVKEIEDIWEMEYSAYPEALDSIQCKALLDKLHKIKALLDSDDSQN